MGLNKMPKHIQDLKEFTNYFVSETKTNKKKTWDKKKKDIHHPQSSFTNRTVIKHNANNIVKFKLRTKKRLLTYKTDDKKTVQKIMSSLPPQLTRVEIKQSNKGKRKAKKD